MHSLKPCDNILFSFTIHTNETSSVAICTTATRAVATGSSPASMTNGELVGSCPQMPSDLEAKVGVHVDTKAPSKQEEVLGYVHLTTTDLNPQLALELPVGNSTYPANANEGTEFLPHRRQLGVPGRPGQVQLGDSANDIITNYEWLHDHGAIAVFDSNRRHEHLDEASLLRRGYDQNDTPYAPCGRLCHSHGYDSQARADSMSAAASGPPTSGSTARTALAS